VQYVACGLFVFSDHGLFSPNGKQLQGILAMDACMRRFSLNRTSGYDSENELVLDGEASVDETPSRQKKPVKKASYESNADVQRWLQEQALEESRVKPEFNPTFLASLRDAPWILSSLSHFYELDLITDILHVIRSGKEATVYCCAAHPETDAEYLAAKVYRPRMFRSLRNDAIYRQSRLAHDERGHVLRDKRRQRGKQSESGRARQVSSWIEYEFETQRLLYNAGADVPRPVSQIGNAVLMEYIGAVDDPAPLLREVPLERDEAQRLFDCILRNIDLWLSYDRIHGDLSEYNILYWRGNVSIIDFAQAVDPHQNPDVYSLLLRDIERVCRYFARYGVLADANELAIEMWTRYMGVLW
jgi:RIO kinase 1